ncbi:MAG: DUF2878 family protein [Candidatus Aenigmarchaeota archaeon]|nr:DUF2878 family protein [Candidatus Aenigmarchaeota archaeon]
MRIGPRLELLLHALAFVLGVTLVSLLYRQSLLLAFLLAFMAAATLGTWRRAEEFYLFLSGAILGSLAEMAAVSFGAWQYAAPDIAGIPLWLPMLWGLAFIFCARLAGLIHRLGRGK